MTLESLLYISRSTDAPGETNASVEVIIATSRANNPDLDLTGALLFTGEHYAQVLEGPPESIDQLMARVVRDPRHRDIMVVAREPIARRRFGSWSMAYSGPSQFVARHVTRLLAGPFVPKSRHAAEWLNDLLWEFAEGPCGS